MIEREKMRFKVILCITFAAALFLVACTNSGNKESSSRGVNTNSDGSLNDYEDIYNMPDDYYVEWAVPNVVDIPAENIAAFNDMLTEEGYDFGFKLINLEYENYRKELAESSCDIAFIGFDDINKDNTSSELIASGFFENLGEYLANSAMYSRISPKLWDSIRYRGNIYTIPNCTAQDVGVSVVFNLDKVSREKAENFCGDISELNSIMGDNGILLYCLNGFEFASYYGFEYKSGILISQEGEVQNLFENNECIEWLKIINNLYINGKATDNPESNWSICITKDIERLGTNNTYIYSKKAILGTRYSASTGILASSDKKDNAFKILDLLHTDSRFANCLIYGNAYTEIDGYAVDSQGEIMDRYIDKLVFGLDESLLWSSDFLIKFSSYQDKIDYYEDNVLKSPTTDIQFEFDTSDVLEVIENKNELWKSKDLKNDIIEIKSALNSSNIQKILSEAADKLTGQDDL